MQRIRRNCTAGSWAVEQAVAVSLPVPRFTPASRAYFCLGSLGTHQRARRIILKNGADLRLHGSVDVLVPGERFYNASNPLVTLILSPEGFVVQHRFRWLSWTSVELARHFASAGQPRGPVIWVARWDEMDDVWMANGRLGVRNAVDGACRFATLSRNARREIAEYLDDNNVRFEPRRPGLGFLRESK